MRQGDEAFMLSFKTIISEYGKFLTLAVSLIYKLGKNYKS